MKEKDYQQYIHIWNNLVLTDHGEENFYERRPDIPLKQVVLAIVFGKKNFAGDSRSRIMVYHRGLKVLYKIDENGKYVIITYYRTRKVKKHNNKKNIYQLFEQISKSS